MVPVRDTHPLELLSPYLDGELADDARGAIEAHLATCASCRALLQDFRAMAAAVARDETPPVPAGLRARIRRAFDTQQASGGAARGTWMWSHHLGLAAAAGVVLVIGVWALRQELTPPGGAPAPTPMVSDTEGERGRTDAGAASVPPPVAPVAPGEAAEQLRSLGYIGGPSQLEQAPPPPPPAASRKTAVERPRARVTQGFETARPALENDAKRAPAATESKDLAEPAVKPAAPAPVAGLAGPAAARRDEVRGDAGLSMMEVARTAAGGPPSTPGAPPGRSLVVEFPAYRVSVSEDGTMTLWAGEYSCTVRPTGPPVDPGVEALFALASSAGVETPRAPDAASRRTPVVRLSEPQSAAGREAGAAPGPGVPAGKAIEIETRLKALLRHRYLALMEDRCGPAPEAVHTP